MKVKLRLSSPPGGWIHGRIADPLISFETSGSNTIATFEAAPMKVPTVGAAAPYDSLPDEVKAWFNANCAIPGGGKCGTRFNDQNWATSSTRNAVMTPDSYSPDAFSQLELWNNFIGDRAGATPSHWYLRTLSSDEMSAASSCISDVSGVAGVVSTNATLYSMGPPAYSGATKTLDYQVAAPHYAEDGSDFLGEYHLLVRSDVARCLYGLVGSNFNARIDVTAKDGTSQDATTSMQRVGDWYKFSATGFTFSAPTIKAALEEIESSGGSSPTSTQLPTPSNVVGTPSTDVAIPKMFGPKIGTPVKIVSAPSPRLVADLGMSTSKGSLRILVKSPKSSVWKIASYEFVLFGNTGKAQIIRVANSKAGGTRNAQFKNLKTGTYGLTLRAINAKGKVVGTWKSPRIRVG
jgi:hypothetical protein